MSLKRDHRFKQRRVEADRLKEARQEESSNEEYNDVSIEIDSRGKWQ